MERFIIIILIFVGTSYAQIDSEYEKTNIVVDEQAQISPWQLEKIINEQLNIGVLPDLQTYRRDNENIQKPPPPQKPPKPPSPPTPPKSSPPSTPQSTPLSKIDIAHKIHKVKELLDNFQRTQQTLIKDESDKVVDLKTKIENIIGKLCLRQQQQAKEAAKQKIEDPENCDKHLRSDRSKTKDLNLRFIINQPKIYTKPQIIIEPFRSTEPKRKFSEPEMVFTPYRKTVEKKKKENVADNIYPQRTSQPFFYKDYYKSYSTESFNGPGEEVLQGSGTSPLKQNKIEGKLNEILNALEVTKDIKCLRTSTTIMCTGSLN